MAYKFIEETFSPTLTHLATVAVASGGTGYTLNDVLTLAGGTGTAATVQVTGVSGGVITSIAKLTGGAYSANPSSPNSPTGGTGTGASLTVTFQTEKGYIMAAKGLMDALALGHVTAASLVSGGTGYTVGDILQLNAAGASARFHARFEVLAVSSGVITSIAMRSSGAYFTLPDVTNTSEATTGGTGSGATVSIDSVEAPHSAAPAAGGSSYVIGDIVTVSGGTLHSGETASTYVVTGVTAGAVTSVEPLHVGRYDTLPTNPASTTGGSGTGLTLTLTHQAWRHPHQTSENYLDGITEFSFWLEGVNAAGGEPVIGVKTISNGAFRWWGLKAATSFDNTKTFELQPNASPGDFTTPATNGGPRIATTDSAVTLFIAWSSRNVNFVSRTSPTYEHGYLGLFLPFIDSPSTKFPYPLLVAGTTQGSGIGINSAFSGRAVNNETTMHASILHHGECNSLGPHVLRTVTGAWNWFETEQSGDGGMAIWPLNGDPGASGGLLAPNIDTGSGFVTPDDPVDTGMTDGSTGTTTTGPFNDNSALNPTPFGPGGDDLYFMVAPLIYEITPTTVQLYGELEGVFAINGRGLSAEDRITDAAGARYFVFTDTLSNENRNFIAIREGDA